MSVGGETIAERYARGARSVVRGDFPISFDQLPEIALTPVGDHVKPEDLKYTGEAEMPIHSWLEERNRWLDPPYKHLAWWAFQAFCREAQADPRNTAGDWRYFNPVGGAGVLGFIQMARHVSNITFAYEKQIGKFHPKPDTFSEQAEEVAAVALASFDDLRVMAEQTPAVTGILESNADHRPNHPRWHGPNSETANHVLDLREEDGRIAARIKHLDSHLEEIRNKFDSEVARGEVAPQRKVGCFALKVVAGDGLDNVMFSIWHGTVLAARDHSEVMESQLKDVKAYVDEYGHHYKTVDIMW